MRRSQRTAPAIFPEQVLHVTLPTARLISALLKWESKIICAGLYCNLASKNKVTDNCLILHSNGILADQYKYARLLLPLTFLIQASVSPAV